MALASRWLVGWLHVPVLTVSNKFKKIRHKVCSEGQKMDGMSGTIQRSRKVSIHVTASDQPRSLNLVSPRPTMLEVIEVD
jgi:hypothetical protein